MNDIELLKATISAYKDYIDSGVSLPEQERSDLLMIARTLDMEIISRGI